MKKTKNSFIEQLIRQIQLKYRHIQRFFYFILPLLLSSCGIYRKGFDCPPGKGVGCIPTSEVLNMIIEKGPQSDDPFDTGENLFIPDSRSCR